MWHSFTHAGLLSVLVLLNAQFATAISSTQTVETCKEVSQTIPGAVKYSGDSEYTEENRDYYNLALVDLKPACIVFPSSTEQVSQIVKILGNHKDVQFVVKSGGHSPNDGLE